MIFRVTGSILNETVTTVTERFLFWSWKRKVTERKNVLDFTLQAKSRAEVELELQKFTKDWTHIRIGSITQV